MKAMRILLALLLALAVGAPAEAKVPVWLLGGKRYVGLLDQVGVSAAAAYSVRLLRVAYAGKALNVRRASDNATQDIGFIGGNLDAGSFNSFCNATTCFVTKAYDQSGNARDISNSTASAQPQLLLNQVGGRPGMKFTGTPVQYLATTSTFPVATSPQTFSVVATRTSSFTTEQDVLTSGEATWMIFSTSANKAGVYGTSILLASAADSAWHAMAGVANGASSVVTIDGADTAGADGGESTATANFGFGARTTGSGPLRGSMTEGMLFTNAALNAAQRGILHTSQSAYYGTP